MCEHHKKTFREFRLRDAYYDFRCMECGWTVEIRPWMKFLMSFGGIMLANLVLFPFDLQGGVFGLGEKWDLLSGIPFVIAALYVYIRVFGYWMYTTTWKLDERDRR